jgi:hypothetical protein
MHFFNRRKLNSFGHVMYQSGTSFSWTAAPESFTILIFSASPFSIEYYQFWIEFLFSYYIITISRFLQSFYRFINTEQKIKPACTQDI